MNSSRFILVGSVRVTGLWRQRMSDDNSEHILLVVAGILFIAGFVFIVAALNQGNGSDSIIGRAIASVSGQSGGSKSGISGITPISCVENNPLDVPPKPRVKGSLTFTYVNKTTGQQESVTELDTCTGSATSISGNRLAEWFCKGPINAAVSVMSCGQGETCADGACTGGLNCTDSDGGKNYLVYGEITGWDPFAHAYKTYNDVCVDDNQLMEYNCVYTGEIHSQTVVCPYGCSNGACVVPSLHVSSCVDSDGGVSPNQFFVNGSVVVNGTLVGVDSCVDGSVKEWYCTVSNGSGFVQNYCPSLGNYVCSNGACVPGTSAPTGNGKGVVSSVKTGGSTDMIPISADVVGINPQNSIDYNTLRTAGVEYLNVYGKSYYSKAAVPISIGKQTHYCSGLVSNVYCSVCSDATGTCSCLGTQSIFSCS